MDRFGPSDGGGADPDIKNKVTGLVYYKMANYDKERVSEILTTKSASPRFFRACTSGASGGIPIGDGPKAQKHRRCTLG